MIGTRLGSYEITARLGEGGMGEVYRATDSQLKREVAIKVLPTAFTADPERLARFAREAQLLAQLNHPNVAQVYGLEASGESRALIMELVEGPTLAERLASGPLPLDEALAIARQIAEALEAAHERGIVHRDLKPQNIKVRGDGAVKVLDFGLAKAMDAGTGASSVSPANSPTLMHSPTLTAVHGTQLGVILGTAAYMAPEQAKGQVTDKRADIWAFGVVLHEMLTGRSLFAGESLTDTLAGVLKTEIDSSKLPAETPPALRTLLRRCLERNPKNRLHDISDARIVLDDLLAGRRDEPAAGPATRPERARGWLIALPWALAAGLALLLALQILRRPAPAPPETARHVEISLPPGQMLEREAPLALAPDGSALVFGASSAASGSRLWLRPLDRDQAVALEETEGATFPFWSPDSKSIAFFRDSDTTLRRYDLATGGTQLIAKVGTLGRSGFWTADGTILFAPTSNSPIRLIPAAGGTAKDVTTLDPSILDGSHRFPVALPDGKHILFTLWSNNLETAGRLGGIYLASYGRGIERRLTNDLSPALLAGDDRLVVYRDGSLVALRFDPERLEVTGVDREIAAHPLYSPASGALAAALSAKGDVAYALGSGEGNAQLAWVDRRGEQATVLSVDRYDIREIVQSRDGKRFAISASGASGRSILVGEFGRPVLTQLSRGGFDTYDPVISPDGAAVAYDAEITGRRGIYVVAADGSRPAELLVSDAGREFRPSNWSSDGRSLILDSNAAVGERGEIWILDLASRESRKLLADPQASLSKGALSPDGKWIAYSSDEAGNSEIFVRPYPALDRQWKLSQGGGMQPHWRADGRELIFFQPSGRLAYAVSIQEKGDSLAIGEPQLLFAPSAALLVLTPAPDHTRFLAAVIPAGVRSEPIHVILGWRAATAGRP